MYANTANAPLIKITGMIAKPSRPSVRLTELELPTIANHPIIKKPNTLSGITKIFKERH